MKTYRKTWRHEAHFLAIDDDDARVQWSDFDLNRLGDELESPETALTQADFVENVSFECVTDDYREVNPCPT